MIKTQMLLTAILLIAVSLASGVGNYSASAGLIHSAAPVLKSLHKSAGILAAIGTGRTDDGTDVGRTDGTDLGKRVGTDLGAN